MPETEMTKKTAVAPFESLLGFIKVLFLYTAVFYFALHPESFAVFVVEYFKIPPEICFAFIMIGFPVAVATVVAHLIAKIFSMRWNHFARKLVHDALLVLLALLFAPVLVAFFIEKLAGRRWFRDRILNFVEERRRHRAQIHERRHEHFLKSEVYADIYFAIFFCLLIILFASYLFPNRISNKWLPERNKYYEAVAYTHYYCQTRHNYSVEECSHWDGVLADLEVTTK